MAQLARMAGGMAKWPIAKNGRGIVSASKSIEKYQALSIAIGVGRTAAAAAKAPHQHRKNRLP